MDKLPLYKIIHFAQTFLFSFLSFLIVRQTRVGWKEFSSETIPFKRKLETVYCTVFLHAGSSNTNLSEFWGINLRTYSY